ncbi:MAG: hypothetical protein JNK74_12575 [Candidatus Hydrogenedentes bacterium]|nr:hypothetical protein [Candidatus Hydrogenedentota bacterium]
MEITGLDKVLHIAVSYFLALFDPALAVAAGLGKEIFDFFGGGVADALDLVADVIGILLAL